MKDFYNSLDDSISIVSKQYKIRNLISIQKYHDENNYWNRLANFRFFRKLRDDYNYHFLYEIQGLSSQLHFGLAYCFLFRDKRSQIRGVPNVYNHRYTFMIESTIHTIYAYWNRVALVLNTYLKTPKDLKRVYFSAIVDQLSIDFPELSESQYYNWICTVKRDVENLNRNEFTHNNSLIMQDFLQKIYKEEFIIELLAYPELLLSHNNYIVEEINNLVELIAVLDQSSIKSCDE